MQLFQFAVLWGIFVAPPGQTPFHQLFVQAGSIRQPHYGNCAAQIVLAAISHGESFVPDMLVGKLSCLLAEILTSLRAIDAIENNLLAPAVRFNIETVSVCHRDDLSLESLR